MVTLGLVKPNEYRDSMVLIYLTEHLQAMSGVAAAAVAMGTEANVDFFKEQGLLTADQEKAAPVDMLVTVQGPAEGPLQDALAALEEMLKGGRLLAGDEEGEGHVGYRSLAGALDAHPDCNVAMISIPGDYVLAEGMEALRRGLHLFIFSDGVSLEDERALKEEAARRGLVVMGPDCGISVLAGVGLGFANVVHRGPVGLVGASGAGLQQVVCLLDRRGVGVSHAIGTGGRDMTEAIGGITSKTALLALADDPATEVLVLVGKTPAPHLAAGLDELAGTVRQPVVGVFLGFQPEKPFAHLVAASTLEEAAAFGAALAQGRPLPSHEELVAADADLARLAEELAEQVQPGQKYLRGVYSGGTFAYEALGIVGEGVSPLHSNLAKDPALVPPPGESRGHMITDLGDVFYTRRRPHPVIDASLIAEKIASEAADPEVAVVFFDLLLGYGAHPDPTSVVAPAVAQARAGREGLSVAATICGAAGDPQGLHEQEKRLREAGAVLLPSNAALARWVVRVVSSIG